MTGGTGHHGLRIRSALEEDFADIARIYAWHVRHGTASLEIDPPDAEEMIARWQAIRARGLPWLVAETADAITGYACASPWRSRSAYRHTVENSVYVRHGYGRQGTGLLLMESLIRQCAALGYRQMIAVIGGFRQPGLDRFSRTARIPSCRCTGIGRPQVRSLGGYRSHAARPRRGRCLASRSSLAERRALKSRRPPVATERTGDACHVVEMIW